jgi:hypothetical protein
LRAIVDELRAWPPATYATTRLEGALGKAIAYMTEMWSGLVRFLDGSRIPIGNDCLLRNLRGPAIAYCKSAVPTYRSALSTGSFLLGARGPLSQGGEQGRFERSSRPARK